MPWHSSRANICLCRQQLSLLASQPPSHLQYYLLHATQDTGTIGRRAVRRHLQLLREVGSFPHPINEVKNHEREHRHHHPSPAWRTREQSQQLLTPFQEVVPYKIALFVCVVVIVVVVFNPPNLASNCHTRQPPARVVEESSEPEAGS